MRFPDYLFGNNWWSTASSDRQLGYGKPPGLRFGFKALQSERLGFETCSQTPHTLKNEAPNARRNKCI